jgi:membrane-associated phospholipid phosphatase
MKTELAQNKLHYLKPGMQLKLARLLSSIGHPLLTVPLVAAIAVFIHLGVGTALTTTLLIVAVVVLPMALHMYRRSRQGVYTNFDVSNRGQRKGWYFFLLALLLLFMGIISFGNFSPALRKGVLPFIGLLLTAQIINLFLKISLHTALNVLLVFLLLPIHAVAALCFGVFTLAVSWSRVALGRHTFLEVLSGAALGLLFGWWLFYNTQ